MEHNEDILKLKDMIQIESTKQLEMKEEHSKILLELKENNRSQIQEVVYQILTALTILSW